MPEKTLKIIFSGITTLSPGPPRDGEKPPDRAYVVMAANFQRDSNTRGGQKSAWGTPIPDHYPFVHVAASLLVDPPTPSENVFVGEDGEHFIYFFRDARVVIYPKPKAGTRIEYFTDPRGHPLAERPGSDDVAQADDIRWLADIRDILSKPVKLKIDLAGAIDTEEVAAIVNLDGGTLRANFPGDTVNPKTFVNAKGEVVPGLRRVLADEFIMDIPCPEDTEQVTLSFEKLRADAPMSGPEKLVLKWPEGEATLKLRMGNDPKDEVRKLDTDARFDPLRLFGPVLKPREDDFDLHYNLFDIPSDVDRPVPQNDVQQCDFQGCKPLGG